MIEYNQIILQKERKLNDLSTIILKESYKPSNENRDDQINLMYLLYIEKVKLETEIKTLKWIMEQN
jgi:hypothetical protein